MAGSKPSLGKALRRFGRWLWWFFTGDAGAPRKFKLRHWEYTKTNKKTGEVFHYQGEDWYS